MSRPTSIVGPFTGALAALLMVTGMPVLARASERFTEYRLVDATTLWVNKDGEWIHLRLGFVDAPKASARRTLNNRIKLPITYPDLRMEWVRWLRQVGVFADPARESLDTLLKKKDAKLTWEEVPGEPVRRSEVSTGTKWVRIEVNGDDVAEDLIEEGWAIPWIPPTVEEPGNWKKLQKKLQQAMNDCRGMWAEALEQCAENGNKKK